jgi:hypothetical protein
VLSCEIELDDAYIGATKVGSKRGRGTTQAPFIAAVEKGKRGRCVLRTTRDLKSTTCKMFAREHICLSSHIRTDGYSALRSGLSCWPGLDPKVFDADDEDGALKTVHHIISNFKNMVIGTYHGVTREYLQSYMDEYCWRYAHRHDRSAFLALVDDMCRHTCKRTGLLEVFAPQPALNKAA